MDIAAGFGLIGWTPRGAAAARHAPVSCGMAGRGERVVMQLDPYRVASLHTHGPVEITCLTGQLWLTLCGKTDDIILKAGESLMLSKPVRQLVLSTVGAPCPASFGIRHTEAQRETHQTRGPKGRPQFQVDFS